METHQYEELRIGGFHLLVVEKGQGLCRLYVGMDGERYCHYDSGEFGSLEEAAEAARRGFDPSVFLLFPYAPYDGSLVLKRAPHAFEAMRMKELRKSSET